MHKLVLAVVLVVSTTAVAGVQHSPEVRVHSNIAYGKTFAGGSGSLGGAWASPDDLQYIVCTTQRIATDGWIAHYGICSARDQDRNVASCYTEDPLMIGVIQSIGAQTFLGFTAVDGTCVSVWAANGSQYL